MVIATLWTEPVFFSLGLQWLPMNERDTYIFWTKSCVYYDTKREGDWGIPELSKPPIVLFHLVEMTKESARNVGSSPNKSSLPCLLAWHPEAESKDPTAELNITSPYVHSRVDSTTFTIASGYPPLFSLILLYCVFCSCQRQVLNSFYADVFNLRFFALNRLGLPPSFQSYSPLLRVLFLPEASS